MKTTKRGFFLGFLIGSIILGASFCFDHYGTAIWLTNFFLKFYHIAWLLTGMVWNENIQPLFKLPAEWLLLYRVLSLVMLYGIFFGVLGVISMKIILFSKFHANKSLK